MKKPDKRRVCLSVALISVVLLLLCEIVKPSSLFDGISPSMAQSADMAVTRALGGAAFLSMLINLGFRVLDPVRKPFVRSLLLVLPAFVVAINNFPFSTVIRGEAKVTEGAGALILLLLECLSVGLFEEMAFRGVVFLGILKKYPQSKLWSLASIAISSAVFGLIHLVNLFEGSPSAVLLQIGYSTLIGAMCSVVLLKTANIWLCVIIHGLFNFCGAVIPRCGEGLVWDTFTIVLTAVLSVLVAAYMIFIFIKDDLSQTENIYKNPPKYSEEQT